MESQAPPGRLLDPDYHAIGIEVHFTPGVTAIFLLRERIGAGFSGYEDAVYADKAYDDKGRIEHVKAQGIMPGILKSARRNTPLTEWERTWNRYLSTLRSPVERVFGTLKRSYGFRRGRYTGLERTWNQALLLCMAFNLRKMIKLLPAS